LSLDFTHTLVATYLARLVVHKVSAATFPLIQFIHNGS
jgi:hypothetical protein